ncbi:hypothetical protein LEMLEM_LOCUS13577 [Lemmus lemmus]
MLLATSPGPNVYGTFSKKTEELRPRLSGTSRKYRKEIEADRPP